jgi:hypothetical protein
VDLQHWPRDRCPAEGYHGALPLKSGDAPHGSGLDEITDSSDGTGVGYPKDVVAVSKVSVASPWDWDPTSSHHGCLEHLPPEIRCYFLKRDVDRLANGTTQPLPPSLLRAHEAACSWCDGSRLHAVDAPAIDSRLCPGVVNRLWYGGQRALYSLFDTLVAPAQALVRRVLAAGQLGAPSQAVHELHPSLLVTATPAAAFVIAVAPTSVFQPGRQFVIGIHLRPFRNRHPLEARR